MRVLRATVEGFYGRPWSHEERLSHLDFCAEADLDTYVYGPKDDPWHRARWREPYPAAELARMAELVERAQAVGVELVYAIHPGLSMRWEDPAEQQALHAKAAQLWEAGVRRFSLFFDDIDLSPDPTADGSAHAAVCRRFADGFLAERGAAPSAEQPLLVVPTEYAGTQTSPYRSAFGAGLPEHSVVFWTGSDIVVGAVTDAEVAAARTAFGRPLALWDNFPVNDFEPSRLFLGPLVDRPTSFDPEMLVGIMANPMVQPRASRIALATVAEYAADPGAYDPDAAHARAVEALVPAPLRPLVEACSSWPPSADPWPALTAAIAAGDHATISWLLVPLAEMPTDLDDALSREVRDWLVAGRALARAAIAAATGDRDVAAAALAEAESVEAGVLRGVLAPYVRAVLEA